MSHQDFLLKKMDELLGMVETKPKAKIHLAQTLQEYKILESEHKAHQGQKDLTFVYQSQGSNVKDIVTVKNAAWRYGENGIYICSFDPETSQYKSYNVKRIHKYL